MCNQLGCTSTCLWKRHLVSWGFWNGMEFRWCTCNGFAHLKAAQVFPRLTLRLRLCRSYSLESAQVVSPSQAARRSSRYRHQSSEGACARNVAMLNILCPVATPQNQHPFRRRGGGTGDERGGGTGESASACKRALESSPSNIAPSMRRC